MLYLSILEINMDQEENKISSGSHSINIGSGKVIDSHLHVGDVHHHGNQSAEPIAYIDRVYTKPVTVFGTPVQAGWLVVSGVVGFIGSVASVAAYWQHLSIVFILVLSLALFCFVVGIALLYRSFAR